MRPVIGITASVDRARWGPWEDDVTLVPDAYVRAVRSAGGRAVVLPAGDPDAGLVEVLDGLVLSGGADLDPGLYGEAPSRRTVDVRTGQDGGELALLRAALGRDLPVLAVCRGMQLLAVAYGGRLHQHLPETPGHEEHGAWGGSWSTHEVALTPGSLAHRLVGDAVVGDAVVGDAVVGGAVVANTAVANSGHHQGVADAGGLRVTGRSADGLAEALEDPARPFVLGVQWHPEMLGMTALFAGLVAAAGA